MRGFLSWPIGRGVLQTAAAVCGHGLFLLTMAMNISRPSTMRGRSGLVLLLFVASLLPSGAADLRREVSRLSANDHVQDIRLSNLERNVDSLQRRVPYSPKGPSALTASSGKSPVAATTVSAKSPVTPPTPETSYSVRPGDTLWRIAMNHRVSPGEIMQLNGLRSDTVQAGQKLRIPSRGGSPAAAAAPAKTAATKPAPAGSATHVIASGDTFSGIAQRYGVSQSALQQANPKVNPNVILIGSTLVIPAGGKPTASTPPPASMTASTAAAATAAIPAAPTPDSSRRHTVQSGETLTSIASTYGVTTAALQHANRLSDPDRLTLGQQLVIPAGGSKPANIVRSTPPAARMASNSATASAPAYPATDSSGLQPTTDAAKLDIPAASPGPLPQDNPRGVLIYRVHSTDTIESIAATFGTTPQKIRELNRKPAGSKVSANEEILVPAMGAVGL